MFSDFKFIFTWWLTLFLLGSVSLPLIFYIFNNFWDKGYVFAKTVSAVLLTYTIFVLGVFKFLPFTTTSLFLIIFIFLLIDFFYLKKENNLENFIKVFKDRYLTFIFEEALFFIVLTTWSFVRGFQPDIEGLEKFMDWGFVNSMLRSQFMPPADMWFSGEPINYYYFGHLIFAVLTKLSNINSAITYNLSIATACALTFISGFSLASNFVFFSLKKPKLFTPIAVGLLSALLLTFGGNLHVVYKITKINIKNEGGLVLTKEAAIKAAQSYWYPDATRFIGYDPETKDKTIHEFPIYSFVVADLHGHMNDIAVVIFFMAFLFSLYFHSAAVSPVNWFLIIPSGFLLSIAYMTNAWDFAVYGLLFGISFFLNLLLAINDSLLAVIKKTFFNGFLIIIFWFIFTLPFSLNFTPMAEGLRFSDVHSPFWQLFILYGGFWLICFPFIFFLITSLRARRGGRSNPVVADFFVLSLIITATILVIIPEIGYIKDIYIYEHRRSNTMFKLVYQAFMMYSLAGGYVLFRLRKYPFYKIIFFLVFICHLIYPYFAVKSYYGLTDYKGLWGLGFLQNLYPDNLKAIEWLNANIKGQPIILEAAGDSYTTFNQISMATGLPTVEGWLVHEWLWRGGYDKPGARAADVQKIYESQDSSEVRSLLQKYNVDYIFVGDKEHEKYPDLNEQNFISLGTQIVFESGKTKIYKLIK